MNAVTTTTYPSTPVIYSRKMFLRFGIDSGSILWNFLRLLITNWSNNLDCLCLAGLSTELVGSWLCLQTLDYAEEACKGHSSLFCPVVNYVCNFFYKIVDWSAVHRHDRWPEVGAEFWLNFDFNCSLMNMQSRGHARKTFLAVNDVRR